MATSLPTQSYKRPGFWARLTSGNPTEAQLGYLLLVPAFLVLALVMFYPIINVVWKSLHYEKLNLPTRGTPFTGLENFREMAWGEGLTWTVTHLSVWRSLLLAALVAAWVFVWRRFSWTALGWTCFTRWRVGAARHSAGAGRKLERPPLL